MGPCDRTRARGTATNRTNIQDEPTRAESDKRIHRREPKTRVHKVIKEPIRQPGTLRTEERWEATAMCGLPSAKQGYHQKQISDSTDIGTPR